MKPNIQHAIDSQTIMFATINEKTLEITDFTVMTYLEGTTEVDITWSLSEGLTHFYKTKLQEEFVKRLVQSCSQK